MSVEVKEHSKQPISITTKETIAPTNFSVKSTPHVKLAIAEFQFEGIRDTPAIMFDYDNFLASRRWQKTRNCFGNYFWVDLSQYIQSRLNPTDDIDVIWVEMTEKHKN
jgi:hypothetical protein